ACPGETEARSVQVKGRDLADGIPKTIVLTEAEVREALRECVTTIVETVRTCLERTPPELAADIVDSGIVLAGGGGPLRGLHRLLSQEPKLPVKIAADPTSCVVLGLVRALDELDLLRRVAAPA